MLNFRLQVFRSAAINLSFTKAAEELFITQPAVTKNIKELENKLKISLFERNKNGISLTNAGKILLNYAENIIDTEKKLEYEISILRESFSGDLKLGASTTIGQYILPSILAQFNKQFPDIALSLRNKNTQEIEKDVINKEIDLGVIEGNSKQTGLKYIPFMRDEIVAIAHTSQPLALKDSINLEELKKIPLVLREIGSGSLEVIFAKLHEQGVKLKDLNVRMYLGSTESIKNFLANSDCIGLVSIQAVAKEIKKGEFNIIDIEGLEITRNFNFIYPHGQQNGFIEKFMAFAMNLTNCRNFIT